MTWFFKKSSVINWSRSAMGKGKDKNGNPESFNIPLNFIFLLCLVIVILNFNWLRIRIVENFEDGLRNVSEGDGFIGSFGPSPDLIKLAIKHIPEKSSVYYWTISHPDLNTAAECRAVRINYHLKSVTVYYRNENNLIESEFILCEESLYSHFLQRLIEIEKETNLKLNFKEIDSAGKMLILRKED